MLASARDKSQIPMELFSRKGSNCVNTVITKIMFCDESHAHHHPLCIGGNNIGDCYDQVAPPPASIALQSWGVPPPAIRVLLLAMQTMRFFLRTGYGELDRSYGGSTEDRTLGLGQGNAVAGPGFLAVSTQIVYAYLRDGHGAQIRTIYTDRTFTLAAVIYVDDTDNTHMPPHVTATPGELIQHSQKSTDAWGGLAIATGAALKPEKCFAYFCMYTFTNGRANMASIGNLPAPLAMILQPEGPPLPSHMTVLLPNRISAPIPSLPPTEASLMLDNWFGPSSHGMNYIAEMCRKGHNWADRLHS